MGNKLFYGIVALIIVAFVGIFIYMNNASNNPDNLSDSGYYPYTDREPENLKERRSTSLMMRTTTTTRHSMKHRRSSTAAKVSSSTSGARHASTALRQHHS